MHARFLISLLSLSQGAQKAFAAVSLSDCLSWRHNEVRDQYDDRNYKASLQIFTLPILFSVHHHSKKRVKEDYVPFAAGTDLPVTGRAPGLKSGHSYGLLLILILGVHLASEVILLLFYQ